MSKTYPIEFILESGTHVAVNKTGTDVFDFSLTAPGTSTRHFSYADDEVRTKAEKEADFDFEQLDAVRTFWLRKEEEGL